MVGNPAADKAAYRTSGARNVSSADAGISVFDDSYTDQAAAGDCAAARSAAVDCNSAAGYVPRPVETAITAAGCRTKGRAGAARRPAVPREKNMRRENPCKHRESRDSLHRQLRRKKRALTVGVPGRSSLDLRIPLS